LPVQGNAYRLNARDIALLEHLDGCIAEAEAAYAVFQSDLRPVAELAWATTTDAQTVAAIDVLERGSPEAAICLMDRVMALTTPAFRAALQRARIMDDTTRAAITAHPRYAVLHAPTVHAARAPTPSAPGRAPKASPTPSAHRR
jgi:hypothetical protein